MNKRKFSARNLLMISLLFVPLLLCTPVRSYGYTDPGSGAFIYQAVYAAFLGGTYYFRKLLDRLWKKRR